MALTTAVPDTFRSLAEDLKAIKDLEEHLPQVRSQVKDVRNIYDRGRDKVRHTSPSYH